MKISQFHEGHLFTVVDIHMWAFKDHLNVLIGKRYIRAFLKWFVKNEACISLIGFDDNEKITGYVIGAPWGYQKEMNKGLIAIAFTEILKRPWVLFNRKILSSLLLRLKTLFGLNKFIETTKERYSGKIVSLVGIGVSEDAIGSGIATLLMKEFLKQAKENDFDYARLSVYKTNTRARKFYEKMNWIPEDSPSAVMGYYKKL